MTLVTMAEGKVRSLKVSARETMYSSYIYIVLKCSLDRNYVLQSQRLML